MEVDLSKKILICWFKDWRTLSNTSLNRKIELCTKMSCYKLRLTLHMKATKLLWTLEPQLFVATNIYGFTVTHVTWNEP